MLFSVITMLCLLNVAVQLLSHSFETDTNECLARPGRMNPLFASGLIFLIDNLHFVFVFNLYPFGMAKEMFFFTCLFDV